MLPQSRPTPIQEQPNRASGETSPRQQVAHSSSDDRDVFSKSEKWLGSPRAPQGRRGDWLDWVFDLIGELVFFGFHSVWKRDGTGVEVAWSDGVEDAI